MPEKSFSWGEQLKWIVPVGIVLGGILWRIARPACEAFFFFIGEGTPSRHEQFVRTPIETELQELAELGERLARAELVITAHTDSMKAFETSLLAQGGTLRDHIAQVFNPLQRTLERMEQALEKISHDTTANSVQIGELRGLWDGSERRHGNDRRGGS